MKSLKILLLSMLCLLTTNTHSSAPPRCRIGLLVMATGRYIEFVPPLIESARKHFCTNHDVTFFVFTDGYLEPADDTIVIYQERLGWPYDTMMRFETYLKSEHILSALHYAFACDADMLFIDDIGNEILSDRVATQHPGFLDRDGDYEKRPISTAYVPSGKGTSYFAGGFYGGSSGRVLELLRANVRNIQGDLNNNIIAVWHDESHLNRYFIDFPPTLILSPSYCFPEELVDNYYPHYSPKIYEYPPKLIALNKNHSEFR